MRKLALSLLGLVLLLPPANADETTAMTAGKPALIVMDVQNAYMPYMDDEGKEAAMWRINAAIDLFRQHGLPIIRVYHTDPERGPQPGSEEFEFPATVRIEEADRQVVKSYPSAFKKTDLEEILREQGCDTVFLSGLSAVGCVLATHFDAKRLELRTFMIKGALLSHDTDLTGSVEEITGAVGFQALQYMLLNAPK